MTAHELPPAAHARPTSAPTATAALLAASLFAALVVPHDALWIGVAIAWAALTAASVHVATRTATRAGGCAFVLAASIGLAAAASLPPIFRWFAEHPASSAPPPRPCSISVGFLCFLAPFGAAAIGAMLGTLLVALVALAHGGRSAVAADRAAMRANAWLIVVSAGAAGLAYVCASDAAVGAAAAIACAGAALFVRAQR
ncbi:MAG TPA: hypothetical protein VIF62_09965, partial [Labilithrix sp.]